MSTPQLSPGTAIDGHTIGALVRTREGASVYEGTDAHGQPASITLYEGSCFPSSLVLERSLRELRQLQNVNSPRVLRVRTSGKYGAGIYEVNDPMPPHSLADHLRSGPLPIADAAGIIVQVGEALLEAQRVGVMHRDLGADVVFPSPEGVRVAGFSVGEPQGSGSFGSLETMAPEQVEGKIVDQRTLIYNLAALMHWMLSGRPLFEGDREAVLDQHLSDAPVGDVHDALARALGKDPRMRPMILGQFLAELASLGGVAPPRPRPTPTGTATGHPAVSGPPVAAPPVGGRAKQGDDAPAAASGSPPAVQKPSTRGWTMFMQAQDDGTSSSKPAPAPPQKPSTRGWTMFMQAAEDEAAQPPEPEPEAPPSGETPEAKPSTRGWTMFMNESEAGGAAATESPAQAPPEPAKAPKPSTRGWTMFTEAEDAPRPSAEGSSEAPETAPSPEDGAPSSRGWTMFMQSSENATAPVRPGAVPESTPDRSADKKRGWTMFMDAPLPAGGDGAPAAAPMDGASDTQGWTVFGAPAPGTRDQAPADGTAQGRTVIAGGPPLAPSPESVAHPLDPGPDVGHPVGAAGDAVEFTAAGTMVGEGAAHAVTARELALPERRPTAGDGFLDAEHDTSLDKPAGSGSGIFIALGAAAVVGAAAGAYFLFLA